MKKHPPKILDNTAEEEARIQAGIDADPDTWVTDPKKPLPPQRLPPHKRAGRPALRPEERKVQVTIKLDRDIVSALKGEEQKGWQTRANKLLREGLGLD